MLGKKSDLKKKINRVYNRIRIDYRVNEKHINFALT